MKQKEGNSRPTLKTYIKVWLKLTALQFQSQVANHRVAALFFIFGKLLRLGFAYLFIYVIYQKTQAIVGYTLAQAVFILSLFNFSSSLTQLFFRGVYQFRQKVQDGSFDFYLINPLSELFYSLFSYTDPLDGLLIIPNIFIVIWSWSLTGYPINLYNIFLILLSIVILFIFSYSLHVLIISIGIKYLEVDNTIMLYRDLEKMASFPIDVYGKYVSSFLTYIIPFTLLATTPAKLVFSLLEPSRLLIFLLIGLAYFYLSNKLWRLALKSYSSASS